MNHIGRPAPPADEDASQRLPLLLDKRRTAAELGISEGGLDSLVRSGRVPKFVLVGSSRRWRSRELIDWINAGCPANDEWHWPPASETDDGDSEEQ